MKKYITIAALLASGTVAANALTPVEVTGDYDITAETAADARLDIRYDSDVLSHTITSTVANATINGFNGYGLKTVGKELTLNVLDTLSFTGDGGKFSDGGTFTMTVNTALSELELSDFVGGSFVRRTVLISDMFASPARTYFSDISVTNLSGYNLTDGGLVYALNLNGAWSYYSASDVSFSGNYAAVSSDAKAITLNKGSLYTFAEIQATNGASVKGYGFIAAIPEPSAFGMLAGLGALALVAARRRRK